MTIITTAIEGDGLGKIGKWQISKKSAIFILLNLLNINKL